MRWLVTLVVIAILTLGLWFFISERQIVTPPPASVETIVTPPKFTVIGKSVEGRAITAHHYGTGDKELLFIGGIHGGYEWNSVLLAYQFVDYLETNSEVIPENIRVTIIPSANPDGVFKIIGKEGRFAITDVPVGTNTKPGRFNANQVDLNRNFDCEWQPESTWQGNKVSAGSKPFSEPEAVAIRDLVLKTRPTAVVSWHSQANAIYAAECGAGISPETRAIMQIYAKASGYQANDSFSAYPVTGDAEGWFASIGIPALTVELKTHETIEWEQNLKGIKALFEYYKRDKTDII